MSVLILVAQSVLGVLLTPLVVEKGLRGLLNVATKGNFNLNYQLNFAVSHYGTYIAALILAILFWLIGYSLARILGRPRVPSVLTLLVTIGLALVFAHLSTLPLIGALDSAFYARTYLTLPPIVYPLLGSLLATVLVRGKHRN